VKKLALAIDLESSGLPPPGVEKGHAQYPWACQIGCILFDLEGNELAVLETLIKSEGRKMQAGAIAVHGISDQDAAIFGVGEVPAYALLCHLAAKAQWLVGFHVKFDRDIAESALIRLNKDTRMLVRSGLEVIDLVQPCAAVCKLPTDHDSGSYRWPNLDVACEKILGEPPREGKHGALDDSRRAKRLFLELWKQNVIELEAAT
jgi:DNA polymerase III epsilon subunit-like protein